MTKKSDAPDWTQRLGKNDTTTFADQLKEAEQPKPHEHSKPAKHKASGGYFHLEQVKRIEAAVICKGRVRKGDGPTKPILVQVPQTVVERLRSETLGEIAPAVVGLIEYALDKLKEEKASLVIENK